MIYSEIYYFQISNMSEFDIVFCTTRFELTSNISSSEFLSECSEGAHVIFSLQHTYIGLCFATIGDFLCLLFECF